MTQKAGQTATTARIVKGLAGELFGDFHEIETLYLESGVMLFGYGVIKGLNEQGAIPVAGVPAIAAIRGVAVRDRTIPRLWQSDEDPQYSAANFPRMDVVRKGKILVPATAIVQRVDPVFFQHTTSGGNLAGTFRHTTDGGNAVDISAIASWFRGNENIGELAVLDLHIEQ